MIKLIIPPRRDEYKMKALRPARRTLQETDINRVEIIAHGDVQRVIFQRFVWRAKAIFPGRRPRLIRTRASR